MPAGKGKGGKGKTRGSSNHTNRGRSRSRNTTPASGTDYASVSDNAGTGITESNVPTYSDIFSYINGSDTTPGSASQSIPSTTILGQLQKDLLSLASAAQKRSQSCDESVKRWHIRLEELQGQEMEKAEKEREKSLEKERPEKKDKIKIKEEKERKKKERTASESSTHRPHALGAHQTTTQAPVNAIIKEEDVDSKKRKSPDEDEDELSPAPKSPKVEDTAMEEDEQPPPLPTMLVYEELDDDPSAYEIGTATDDMTVDEKKKIFSVAIYPTIDITDLLPGDPPDEDFSRAKPTNQVAMNSFATYIEPYFRVWSEEDMAFLRERPDPATPYLIPALGRHYTEVWAEEDGSPIPALPRYSENAMGKPDDLDESKLEQPNGVSLGPLLSRVLAGMIPEDHEEVQQNGENNATTNGDVTMGNAAGTNGVPESQPDTNSQQQQPPPTGPSQSVTALNLPEGPIQPKDWKLPSNRPDYGSLEERIRQEMIFMGMVGPSDTYHHADRQDDEVCARLRFLQTELRAVAIRNGARKARLSELLKEQLAYQEYSTILDDLDKQVDQAYIKRTRGMKAKKKRAGPNGHAAGGAAKPGIGDVARTLMERRKKWSSLVGPVFEKGVTGIPKETIFDPAIMIRLEQKEALGEEVED